MDLSETVISQYATAPTLTQLVANLQAYIDPSADIDAFYSLVWDVSSAVGYGLDVWGRIVDVSRVVQVVTGEAQFGFKEATDAETLGFGTFYAGAGLTSNFALSDDAYRVLIYAKGLSNICDGSIPAINQIMRYLFPGRGNAYVIDNHNMTMKYKFAFTLTAVELAVVSQSGVLAKPAGIVATIESP